MNKSNGVALLAVGLAAGVVLSSVLSSGPAPQSGPVAESQPVTSPAASPAASPVSAQQVQPQSSGRLETKNLAFQNIKIARYTGDVPDGSDVAGELYQVTATITNRSNETMSPSGLGGVSYKLKDSQDRKYQAADFLIGLGDDGLKSTDGILPGQTRESIIVGVFDVLPGATGLELGVNDGWFSDTKYAGPAQTQQAAAQPPAQPPATTLVSAPASSVTPAAPQPVAFESLAPCDQLDAVAKSGKSVSEFLVSAHRVNDLSKYKSAIGAACPWNNEQLAVADRIINPPVVVVRPRVVRQSSGSGSSSGSSGGSGGIQQAAPAPRWNNCNGIQEPGESYSASCEAWQRRQSRNQPEPKSEPRPAPEPSQSAIPFQPGYGGSN